MKKKLLTTVTVTMATALAVAMVTPLAGCSGCSAKREPGTIEKTTDSKSVKKEAGKTKAQKDKDFTASTDAETTPEAAASGTKSDSSESKSSAPAQTTPSKVNSSKPEESNGDGTKPTVPQKNWIPKKGHWETDYEQVWVPNIVYTRHERWSCSACGASFDSAGSIDDHVWETCGDTQHPNGASAINNSYTTTEDQGRYERQAAGQHWVVDTTGHWE